MTDLLLKIAAGVAALAFGVWLGRPGRKVRGSRRTVGNRAGTGGFPGGTSGEHDPRYLRELDNALARPGRTRRAKRHFTPLDLLKPRRRTSGRQQTRRVFSTVAPSPKDGEGQARGALRDPPVPGNQLKK